jgi:hypothetical protein
LLAHLKSIAKGNPARSKKEDAMLKFKSIVAAAALAIAIPTVGWACDTGHWINEVVSDGAVIVLEDGSTWLVDYMDRIDTALWLPISDVIICNDTMINTDDGEKAHVRRLH